MKSIHKITMLLFLGGTIALSSCKKYEDGPMVSFRSKEQRMANTWKVEKATENGNDVTSDYDQYDLQLFSDGDAKLAAVYTLGDFTFEYETDGTWDFSDDKEELELNMENDQADKTYQILRLKEEELWLREKGQEVELHLIPR